MEIFRTSRVAIKESASEDANNPKNRSVNQTSFRLECFAFATNSRAAFNHLALNFATPGYVSMCG